jgi:adenylylsulfate kinase
MINLYKQETLVSRAQRNKLNQHTSLVIWFTGLSGSGKSTVASALQAKLHSNKIRTYMLDGDNIRMGLNGDLDFTEDSRKENIRRVAEVAKLFTDAGCVTLCSFISPFEDDRAKAKTIIGSENFIEVYLNCDLAVCEERDVKGLYKKARNGEIKNFTGIDSPYEVPKSPDIELESARLSIDESVDCILDILNSRLK